MRRIISIASFIGAGVLAVGFVENNMLSASIPAVGWMFVWLAAQKKRPCGGSQGKKTLECKRNLYLYDIADDARFQEQIRIFKAWEEVG